MSPAGWWGTGYAKVGLEVAIGESAPESGLVHLNWLLRKPAHRARRDHAGKLRANFSFDDLNAVPTASTLATAASPHRDEPIVLALRSFAAFGSRALTTEYARDLLDRPGRPRSVRGMHWTCA
ncbi:hypothetical protein [Streptomyces sp. NPDC051109]|uniref:hypothetical protein n=1 Tax=Streptomyces sp. NPDC051109 TaxID=3365642 RepID=UPI0037B81B85